MSQFKELVERKEMDLRVAIPCTISDYDPERVCATVTPAYRERIMGENNRAVVFEDLQPIEEVPIADFGGIRFVPDDDSHGWLFFSDVDLQNYLASRDPQQDLQSAAFHDYSDCICLPLEVAKDGRPAPYITIGCDVIQMHRPVQMDETLLVSGDVDIEGSAYVNDEFVTAGNVSFFSDFTVDGNASFVGDFTAAAASFEDGAAFGDSISVAGNTSVSGEVGASNFSTNATNLNQLSQAFLTHNHLLSIGDNQTALLIPPTIFTQNPPVVEVEVEEAQPIEPIDVAPIECPAIG